MDRVLPGSGDSQTTFLPTPEMFLDWDITKPSAWLEHAPFMGWIVGRQRPRTFVELGTHWGLSYFAACSAAKSVGLQMESIAVDTWEGEHHAGVYGDEVFEYVTRYNEGHFGRESHLFRGYFDDAADTVADGSLDLLHIDGLHTYEAVRHDFETWLPKMSSRGIVLFHDIAERMDDFGVHKFWAEIVLKYPSFRFLHGHGLGVLAVGDSIGPDVAWLCAQDSTPDGDRIRVMFKEFGKSAGLTYGLKQVGGAVDLIAERAFGSGPSLSAQFLGRADPIRPGLLRAESAVDHLRAELARAADAEQGLSEELRQALLELASAAEAEQTLRDTMLELIQEAEDSAAEASETQRTSKFLTLRVRESREEVQRLQEEVQRLQEERDAVAASRSYRAARAIRHPVARLGPRGKGGRWGSRVATPPGESAEPITDQVHRLFDPAFYLSTYPDVAAEGLDAWEHYTSSGAAEGRRPSPLFDPDWYLKANFDVASAGVDPVVHYLSQGWLEGRDPIPEFDTDWYLGAYPDIRSAEANPLLHFIESGAAEGRRPNPDFDTPWYLETYRDVAKSGINPLVHYILYGAAEGRRQGAGKDIRPRPVAEVLVERLPSLRPLRVINAAGEGRVNLITDSVKSDSLFGGVATALIVAALWAERSNRRLRVVTRQAKPDASGLSKVLQLNGLRLSRSPELVYIPEQHGDFLEINRDDVFLTTSWWTTHSTLASIPASRIAYILQEDEREFYPSGDDRLRAGAVMNHPELLVIVNTQGLLDFLTESGLDNLRKTASSFEPSFSAYGGSSRVHRDGVARNLFFYARPNNPRNLFALGLQALEKAIEGGVIDTETWRIHLVGRDIPRVVFSDGSLPEYHETLSWPDYRRLLSQMDLGLSLMSTPHPSYPPLDLASAGCVVVTNTWPGKQSLSQIGTAIFEAAPTVDALVNALELGVQAVVHPQAGRELVAPYSSSWASNLSATVERLLKAR